MKEFIAAETSKNDAEEEKRFYPLRQRDINIGAGLMFIGALKAILAIAPHGFTDFEIAVLPVVLGIFFSAIVLFSQLSPRQRGLTLGATIIFVGTLVGIVASLVIGVIGAIGAIGPAPGMFFPISISLIVSLLWTRLVRIFMQIFFDKEVAPEKKVPSTSLPGLNPTAASAPALSPAQNAPDVEPTTNRMKEAEIAMPVSVTENTTKRLKNKQSFTQS